MKIQYEHLITILSLYQFNNKLTTPLYKKVATLDKFFKNRGRPPY